MTDGHAVTEGRFDLEKTCKRFQESKADGNILMLEYIAAFKELNNLFYQLGRLFHFVAHDVVEKIHVLESLLASDSGANYATVEQMLNFEAAEGLLHKKDFVSGSRSLLRLHRALQFIVRFIDDIKNSSDTDTTSSLGIKGYDETLGKHHPWLIRKTVHLALYTLPYRKQLVDDIGGHWTKEEQNFHMSSMVEAGHEVYATVEQMYDTRKLLDLP